MCAPVIEAEETVDIPCEQYKIEKAQDRCY